MEKINDYFLGLTSESTPLEQTDIESFLVSEIPEELYLSVHEAYKALRSVKTKKSAGPDGIPNSVLKEFAFELAPVIADIYNASLREGYILTLLKTAAVCPIPKKSPPKSIETDIRPISLTCQVAKLLEGFTLARIYKPILSDLDKKQFALAVKSTELALVYLLHIALEALHKGNCSVRFFFADFRKGFDLIDHGILLQKLCNYNIHNCLTRWVVSFLEGRSQFIRIDKICSSTKALRGGIPQGTKLVPIMFAVMVNDLLSRWRPRAKFVDDLTALEIIPRNSPSMMNFIVEIPKDSPSKTICV